MEENQFSKLVQAVRMYVEHRDRFAKVLEECEDEFPSLSEFEQGTLLIEAGMTRPVALYNDPTLWNLLLQRGLAVTPAIAQRAFEKFVVEGAICSLRHVLPHVQDINAEVGEGCTALAYSLNRMLSDFRLRHWFTRMHAECAKALLDAGADWKNLKFLPDKLGLGEMEMIDVLMCTMASLKYEWEPRLSDKAGTPNDDELCALIILLRSERLPECTPQERAEAKRILGNMKNWRTDLAGVARRIPALFDNLYNRVKSDRARWLLHALLDN